MSDHTSKEGAGILFVVKNKFLLLKRSPDRQQPNKWCIPGGKKEKGEYILQTAIRETKEETGFVGGKKLGSFFHKENDFDWTTFIFKVDKEFKCKLNHEHSKYKWSTVEEAEKLNLIYGLKKKWNTYKKIIGNV